jgi:hypothetical protein
LRRLRRRDTPVRLTLSLPPITRRRVKALAKTREASASQVVAELIERGLEAHDRERQRFMQLTDRLAKSSGDAEEKQATDELADMIFGADE